ncbi:MAG: hypothetical protein ACJ77Y_03035 [Chloroflexota bacterium]
MKTIAPPTTTFNASIALVNHAGSGGGTGSINAPMIPEARKTMTHATNQRTASRTSEKTRAASGARIPQKPTAAAGTNPPRGIIDSVGARRMATWPVRSSCAKSRFREKTTIDPTMTAK